MAKDRSSAAARQEPAWIIVRSVSPRGDFGRAGFRFSPRDTSYPLNEAAQRITGGTIIPETRRVDGNTEPVLARIKAESFLAWRITDDVDDARANAPEAPQVTQDDLKAIVLEQQKQIAEMRQMLEMMSRAGGGSTHPEDVAAAKSPAATVPGARVG
jgi:hypothetical protein